MLIKGYSFKPKTATVGENVEPFLENDIEALLVEAAQGFLNVGCFCARKLGGRDGDGSTRYYLLTDLNENSTVADVFGFILADQKNVKRIPNGGAASVVRLDSPFVVCPLTVDVDGCRDDVKIIKSSKDKNKYPIGAVILSQQPETDEYSTITISGTVRIIDEE